jgi:hypothetical protein
MRREGVIEFWLSDVCVLDETSNRSNNGLGVRWRFRNILHLQQILGNKVHRECLRRRDHGRTDQAQKRFTSSPFSNALNSRAHSTLLARLNLDQKCERLSLGFPTLRHGRQVKSCPIALLYHKSMVGNVLGQGNTDLKPLKFVAPHAASPVALGIRIGRIVEGCKGISVFRRQCLALFAGFTT